MIITEEKECRGEVESVYFTDNGCRGREKIIEEADRNFLRKEGNGKKNRNNGIWVLTRYDNPDFGQIKIGRPDRYESEGRGMVRCGNWRIKVLCLRICEDHNDSNDEDEEKECEFHQ